MNPDNPTVAHAIAASTARLPPALSQVGVTRAAGRIVHGRATPGRAGRSADRRALPCPARQRQGSAEGSHRGAQPAFDARELEASRVAIKAADAAIAQVERQILEPLTALLSLYGAYTNVKKPAAIGAIEVGTAKFADTLTVGAVGVTVSLDAPVPNWARHLPHRPPALLQTEPTTVLCAVAAGTPSPSPTPAPTASSAKAARARPPMISLFHVEGAWNAQNSFEEGLREVAQRTTPCHPSSAPVPVAQRTTAPPRKRLGKRRDSKESAHGNGSNPRKTAARATDIRPDAAFAQPSRPPALPSQYHGRRLTSTAEPLIVPLASRWRRLRDLVPSLPNHARRLRDNPRNPASSFG